MNTRDEDYDDLPSIVPERDELHESRNRKRGNSLGDQPPRGPAPGGGGGARPRPGTSGAVVFLLSVLVVGLLATAGAGYFFYDQGRQALGELRNAQGRIADLENRLSAVGEDTEQTTLNMIERIDTNFSEIDKLWAARNANRSNIAENRASIEKLQTLAGEIETAVGRQGEMLNQTNNQLMAMQSTLEGITENISGLERMGERVTNAVSELEEVRQSMTSLRNSVDERLSDMEENIESINVYRLQLNQTLSNMQQDIDGLQERVGR